MAIPGSTYVPPTQEPLAYEQPGGYATEPAGGNDTYYATSPEGQTYTAQGAPEGNAYSLTPYDSGQPPPSGQVGYQEQAPRFQPGALMGDAPYPGVEQGPPPIPFGDQRPPQQQGQAIGYGQYGNQRTPAGETFGGRYSDRGEFPGGVSVSSIPGEGGYPRSAGNNPPPYTPPLPDIGNWYDPIVDGIGFAIDSAVPAVGAEETGRPRGINEDDYANTTWDAAQRLVTEPGMYEPRYSGAGQYADDFPRLSQDDNFLVEGLTGLSQAAGLRDESGEPTTPPPWDFFLDNQGRAIWEDDYGSTPDSGGFIYNDDPTAPRTATQGYTPGASLPENYSVPSVEFTPGSSLTAEDSEGIWQPVYTSQGTLRGYKDPATGRVMTQEQVDRKGQAPPIRSGDAGDTADQLLQFGPFPKAATPGSTSATDGVGAAVAPTGERVPPSEGRTRLALVVGEDGTPSLVDSERTSDAWAAGQGVQTVNSPYVQSLVAQGFTPAVDTNGQVMDTFEVPSQNSQGVLVTNDAFVSPQQLFEMNKQGHVAGTVSAEDAALLGDLVTEEDRAGLVGRNIIAPPEWAAAMGWETSAPNANTTYEDVPLTETYTGGDSGSDSNGYTRRSSSSGGGGGGGYSRRSYGSSGGGYGGGRGGGAGYPAGNGAFDLSGIPADFGGGDFLAGMRANPMFANFFSNFDSDWPMGGGESSDTNGFGSTSRGMRKRKKRRGTRTMGSRQPSSPSKNQAMAGNLDRVNELRDRI